MTQQRRLPGDYYRRFLSENVDFRFSRYREELFGKHFHSTYSIGLITSGYTKFLLRNSSERTYIAKKNDLVFINPGEIHACNPREGSELSYYMVYVQPAFIHQISAEIGVRNNEEIIFLKPILTHYTIRRSLATLFESIIRDDSPLQVESLLYDFFFHLFQTDHSSQQSPAAKISGKAVARAHTYLMEHLCEPVTLAELAEAGGLSKFHFLKAFRANYGIPPHRYQVVQRINLAKDLLDHGQPIANVAIEVGFSDQSHFTRAFRSIVGVTPYQYAFYRYGANPKTKGYRSNPILPVS